MSARSRGPQLMWAGLFAFVVVLLCLNLHKYVDTSIWHCCHGYLADIGSNKVRVPWLWRQEDAHAYDTLLLKRAYPSINLAGAQSMGAQIVMSPVIPGELRSTDQEELQATQDLVSSRKGMLHTKASLVELHSRRYTFYCSKVTFSLIDSHSDTNLFCHSVAVPYSFSFDGPLAREREAESILASLE